MGDLLFSSLFLRRRFRLLLSKVSGKVKEEQTMLFGFLSHAGWRSSEFVEAPSSLRKSSVSTESKHQRISISTTSSQSFFAVSELSLPSFTPHFLSFAEAAAKKS